MKHHNETHLYYTAEEKERIVRTLKQANGNKQLAAKLLDIGRTKPYTQMKEYGIKKNDS
ncbi:hypothetical protein HCG69_06645 [Bacteroides sp. K03]|uniref:helix-turn-helix domain-containing protein n=1 Tax=Bacteroides TaxID=816 RepID=UPI001C8B3A25|nr:hypothetical protein [Bacteroides sp. K03]